MISSLRTIALVGAALFALGGSVAAAAALPAAPVGTSAVGAEPVAYLHRHYPGYNSRSARTYRHARRNFPNRYCRNQPSRCR